MPYRTFFCYANSTQEAEEWIKILQWKLVRIVNTPRPDYSIAEHRKHRFKVPLGPEFWHSMFLHSHHAKFQLLTTNGSCFFRTVFVEILQPPLLALVPEAGLRISGSDIRGSPQTWCLHMVTYSGKRKDFLPIVCCTTLKSFLLQQF